MVVIMPRQDAMKADQKTPEHLVERSVDTLDEALLMADSQGIVRWINRAFGDAFGVRREEVVGASRRALLEPLARRFRDPDILVKNLAWLYDHPVEEERATWELAGGQGLVRWYSRPVRDTEGRIIGRIESYRQVDGEELSRCGVEKESVDALPIGVVVVDDRLDIVWRDRYAGQIISDVLGFDPRELGNLEALGHDHPLVRAVIGAIGDGRTESRYGLAVGDRYFDVIVTPLASGDRVRGAVAALIDAGEQHERMARCDRLRQESEFYVNLMSHDIRNFNQVSMGYLEMLEMSEGLPPDARVYLERALGGVLGSNKLIDDVKRARAIRESGGRDIAPVDLCKAIDEDVRQVRKAHEDEPVVINANTGCDYPVLANGLLHDIFRHILDNAIKFDPHPEKVIDIDIVGPEAAGDGYVTVRVADHGPGIPDERKKAIFERMSGGSTRGAGLGLSIVKLIVDKLGGRIWVEDRVPGDQSQGSVFVVQLRKAS